MKIIRISANDFVKAEVAEWGYDYVDAQFAQGFEPILVNGVWCWRKPVVTGIFGSATTTSDRSSTLVS